MSKSQDASTAVKAGMHFGERSHGRSLGWRDVLRVLQNDETRKMALARFKAAGFTADEFGRLKAARNSIMEALGGPATVGDRIVISVSIPIKTTNPCNGSQGWSKNAAYAKARRRKTQRTAVGLLVLASLRGCFPAPFIGSVLPCEVTVTRLAPSSGLDPHDGLGAALKGAIDGVTDALGLKSDRDPSVTWVLAQERAKKYSIRVDIRRRES